MQSTQNRAPLKAERAAGAGFDICSNGPPFGVGNKAACQAGGERYEMRSDFSVWYPVIRYRAEQAGYFLDLIISI